MKTKFTSHLKSITLLIVLVPAISIKCALASSDTLAASPPTNNLSFLVVPYKPMMHLSDADNDIAYYSEMNPQEIRSQLRMGLLKNLNTKLMLEYETNIPEQDFVQNDERDLEQIYNSLSFGQDTVFPLKANAQHDSLHWKKNVFTSKESPVKNLEKTYINVDFYDQQLLPDLARKYNADYFIFFE